MFVIKHKAIFFTITAGLMLASLIFAFIWPPSLSIEFTGGSVVEGHYASTTPAIETLNTRVSEILPGSRVTPVGDTGLVVRTKDLSSDEHNKLIVALSPEASQQFVETDLSTVGPSIGSELRSKALLSVILVLALIILFVAFSFRSASRVVSSWKFGLSVIICLVHDIFVPVGIFAVIAHFIPGYEIDTLFVTAILAILGYSVADTIVVFDRIRENLKHSSGKEPFEDVVGRSLRETYARSINTSLTTVLAALAILFFGGEATRHFALMLAIGIAVGTYSSILLASPLLVYISGKSKTGQK